MTIVILILGLLAIPLAAGAHDETKGEKATLTVTGAGHLAVAPDTAFVTFGVDTANKSLTDAQKSNVVITRKVAERLRDLQIEPERIQTSSLTVSPQYRPPPKRQSDAPSGPPEIIGYMVSNTMTVEVRQIEKIGTVIEESLGAGANQFQGLHWALRDEQQAKLAALKQAAVKANEKALTLSQALKVRLVRLVSAQEEGHVVHPVARASRGMMAMEAGGGEPPIFSGEMKVEATVTLVYDIASE